MYATQTEPWFKVGARKIALAIVAAVRVVLIIIVVVMGRRMEDMGNVAKLGMGAELAGAGAA
jgi:hypothetical protein